MKIPVTLVGKKVFIKTDVVDSGLPLLFSKPSMKKAGVKLDLENDTAIILGKSIKLNCTSSGHYCIPLYDEKKIEEAMFTLEGNEKEMKRKVRKLHHQFGHPTCKRLTQLFSDAEINDERCFLFADEISNNCDVCIKYKKTPPRPIVSTNIARNFNAKTRIQNS